MKDRLELKNDLIIALHNKLRNERRFRKIMFTFWLAVTALSGWNNYRLISIIRNSSCGNLNLDLKFVKEAHGNTNRFYRHP